MSVIAASGISDGVNPMPRRVLAGHETRTTGSTIGCTGVGISEDQAFCSQAVNTGRFMVIAAHETHVRPAHIVDEKEDDVRFLASEYIARDEHVD